MITDEDISLAWSPEPPFESMGAGDCRPGGSSGIDFNCETPRARWVRARFRYAVHVEQESRAHELDFDLVCRPCRCRECVHKRLLRLFTDLDMEYGPPPQLQSEKETIQ